MASHLLRVTHVVLTLKPGGLEYFVAQMARRWARSPIRLSVVNMGGHQGGITDQLRPYIEQLRVLNPVPHASMVAPVGLIRCLRKLKPDVVHIHSGTWYKGALAARLAGVPRIIYTEHGLLPDDHFLGPYVRQRAAKWTDAIVAVSKRLGSQLLAEFPARKTPVLVIPNGVDTGKFRPGPRSARLLERLRIPRNARIIGSVGRLETIKAHDLLLEAFAALRSQIPDSSTAPPYLVICGQGSQREALLAQARSLGIDDVVRFPGWVNDPAAFYRLFDVFVLCSITEGAPLSLLEAMASGVAPIVTRVGANAEILGRELGSQLVPSGDRQRLTAALAETLSSHRECNRLGELARGRVLDRYDFGKTIERYEELYDGPAFRTSSVRAGSIAR